MLSIQNSALQQMRFADNAKYPDSPLTLDYLEPDESAASPLCYSPICCVRLEPGVLHGIGPSNKDRCLYLHLLSQTVHVALQYWTSPIRWRKTHPKILWETSTRQVYAAIVVKQSKYLIDTIGCVLSDALHLWESKWKALAQEKYPIWGKSTWPSTKLRRKAKNERSTFPSVVNDTSSTKTNTCRIRDFGPKAAPGLLGNGILELKASFHGKTSNAFVVWTQWHASLLRFSFAAEEVDIACSALEVLRPTTSRCSHCAECRSACRIHTQRNGRLPVRRPLAEGTVLRMKLCDDKNLRESRLVQRACCRPEVLDEKPSTYSIEINMVEICEIGYQSRLSTYFLENESSWAPLKLPDQFEMNSNIGLPGSKICSRQMLRGRSAGGERRQVMDVIGALVRDPDSPVCGARANTKSKPNSYASDTFHRTRRLDYRTYLIRQTNVA